MRWGSAFRSTTFKAYDWLSKAVAALPEGTRRTVAEANRDAVLKRMSASQQAAVAAVDREAETPAATPDQARARKPRAKPATDARKDQDFEHRFATTKPAATTTRL